MSQPTATVTAIDTIRPRPARPGAKTCPTHRGTVLDGGPVRFHCPAGHGVMAADIPTDRTEIRRAAA